jgi:hypothetical protein
MFVKKRTPSKPVPSPEQIQSAITKIIEAQKDNRMKEQKEIKSNWLWSQTPQSLSKEEENILFSYDQKDVNKFYGVENIFYKDESENNSTYTPTGGSIARAGDIKLQDKKNKFIAVLSEKRLWNTQITEIAIGSKTNNAIDEKTVQTLGIKLGPVMFRRGYDSTVEWAKLFEEVSKLENVEVLNFVDAPFPQDISMFEIDCYDPLVLQQIDILIGECKRKENNEYIRRLKNQNQSNSFKMPF